MISKNKLKGKYVTFRDKNGATRTAKVIKITGNTITVKNAVGEKERVYKDKVFGRQFRKRGLEEIKWSR